MKKSFITLGLESAHFVHVQRHVFALRGPYVLLFLEKFDFLY